MKLSRSGYTSNINFVNNTRCNPVGQLIAVITVSYKPILGTISKIFNNEVIKRAFLCFRVYNISVTCNQSRTSIIEMNGMSGFVGLTSKQISPGISRDENRSIRIDNLKRDRLLTTVACEVSCYNSKLISWLNIKIRIRYQPNLTRHLIQRKECSIIIIIWL